MFWQFAGLHRSGVRTHQQDKDLSTAASLQQHVCMELKRRCREERKLLHSDETDDVT